MLRLLELLRILRLAVELWQRLGEAHTRRVLQRGLREELEERNDARTEAELRRVLDRL